MDLSRPLAPLDAFALDPDVLHLNHGSYGACPRAALAEQDALRARIEAAPMRFMMCQWEHTLALARIRLGELIAADPEDVVFLPNATTGVSSVLASLPWTTGDRLVVTDHGYRACANAARRLAETRGVEVVTVRLCDAIWDPTEVVARVVAAADDRTRLVMIDHITSPTAAIIDVGAVCAALAPRGIDVLVDGAHAPGQIAVDVRALGAAYYAANCHKWMCAPKGSGLLWARRDRRDALRPLVTSHGETPGFGPPNRFHARFDWSGTHDPTAYLATPAAIDAIAELGGGWPAVRARNHALVLAGRDRIAARLGLAAWDAPAWVGSMVTVPIGLPAGESAIGLEYKLVADGFETALTAFGGRTLLRLSAHVYNQLADYDRLADELAARGCRAA